MNSTKKSPKKFYLGVRTKLLASFAIIALTTIAASSIGFYSFSRIEQSIARITGDSVPGMTSAISLAQQSHLLETSMPLLAIARDHNARKSRSDDLRTRIENIRSQAMALKEDPKLQAVFDDLAAGLTELDGYTEQKITNAQTLDSSLHDLLSMHDQFDKLLLAAVDDAGFNLVITAEDVTFNSKDALDKLVNQSLVKLNAGLQLKAETNALLLAYNIAGNTDDTKSLAQLASRTGDLVAKILEFETVIGPELMTDDLQNAIATVTNIATADDNIFLTRVQEIGGNTMANGSAAQIALAVNTQEKLNEKLAGVIDTVYFDLVMAAESVETLNTEGVPRLMDPGVKNLRLMLEYRANSNLLLGLLSESAQVDAEELLTPMLERFNAVQTPMLDSLPILSALDQGNEMADLVKAMIALGNGPDNVFDLRRAMLEHQVAFNTRLDAAKSILSSFMTSINENVELSKEAVAVASGDSLETIEWSKNLLSIFAISSLVVTVLLLWLLVSRNIIKRLIRAINALQKIADGDLDSDVDITGNDELAELARTVQIFREKSLETLRLQEAEKNASEERRKQREEQEQLKAEQQKAREEQHLLEREQAERERRQAEALKNDTDALLAVVTAASNGDLTQPITVQGDHPAGQLGEGLGALIQSFTEVMHQITLSAQTVASGSADIARGNSMLSDRTNQQAQSLEETTATMISITDTVKENFNNARHANTLASQAQQSTEKVSQVVTDTVSAMNAINESSEKIAEIVGVIDDMAFQTNLLALNASVEAARAGEQGRGFAVVASEVRNLAERSATAAQEIKNLIDDSVQKVTRGVTLVDSSGKTLDELALAVTEVTGIVEKILVGSEQQDHSIQTIHEAVSQLEEMTRKNANMVDTASRSSASMAEQSDKLREQIDFFTFDSVNDSGRRAA